jgi:hypothetical protein
MRVDEESNMADLKAIQDKLNKDANEKAKFVADPVGYLQQQGLTLSPDAAQQVSSKVKSETQKPGGAADHAWSVGVVVGT